MSRFTFQVFFIFLVLMTGLVTTSMAGFEPDTTRQANCGSVSLAYLLEEQGQPTIAKEVRALMPASAKGFSVAELLTIAETSKVPLVARQLQVNDLKSLQLPAIVLLEGKLTGHYLVLRAVDQQQVHLIDPQVDIEYQQNLNIFTRNWSGIALLKGKKGYLPGNRLSSKKAGTFYGGHAPLQKQNDGENGDPDNPCESDGENKCCDKGAPVWKVNPINYNLYVGDLPIWYDPAIGPKVRPRLSYNSLVEPTGEELFGNKWIFRYESFLQTDVDGNVTITMPDGREDKYLADGTGGYNQECSCTLFKELSKISEGHFELLLSSGTVYDYTQTGVGTTRLSAIRDSYGQEITLGYTGDRLTSITDSLGQQTTLVYNGQGLVERIDDPFGRAAVFVYDADRNLTRITDMGGYATDLEYDGQSLLTALVNQGGRTEFLTEQSTPKGERTMASWIEYPPPGSEMGASSRITITHPGGAKEEYYYNGVKGYSWHVAPGDYEPYEAMSNNFSDRTPKTIYYYANTVKGARAEIRSINRPNGEKTIYTYDAQGRRNSISDAAGNTIRKIFNDKGRVLTRTAANGVKTYYTYTANDLDLIRIEDPLGTIEATYNDHHDPVSVIGRDGLTTHYVYSNFGQLISSTDPLNIETLFSYNAAHQMVQVSRNGQVLSTRSYDQVGRVKTSRDATGFLLEYDYDALDHLASVTYPDGRIRTYTYNSPHSPHLVTSITDRTGMKMEFSYNPQKQFVRSVNSAGLTRKYDYDLNGNLTSFTDANGNVTRFVYGPGNHLLQRTYADGTIISYRYNNAGLLEELINGRGQHTLFYYDENYNLLTVDHEDDTPDVYYDYDDAGRVTQIEDGSGITLFTYGPDGRLQSLDGPLADDTVTYGYDLLGRRTTLQPQKGQEVSYVYDSLNRLEKVRLGTAEYIYGYGDPKTPLIATLTRPNGSLTTYDYDPLNRLLAITNQTSTGEIISKHAYTYNNQDLRDTETVTGGLPVSPLTEGLIKSNHNQLNQLLNTTNPDQSFSYDADGNMTRGYTLEGFLFTATYDAENRLHSIEYTDADSHIQRRVYTYRWDDFLVRIETYTDGALVDDVRIIRGGLLALQDRDNANTVLREYTWGANQGGGIGGLLNLRQNGVNSSYLYDGKGNVDAILDNTQAMVASYRYNAFGKLVNQTGPLDQPFQFSTKRYDAGTGLNYYGYRFYAPAIERWMNRDPLGEAGGINLYGFVLNDPVNWIDPWGLKTGTDDDCAYCPGGEWSSFSHISASLFFGGGGTIARTTYTCKSNGKQCSATAICFGGGPIAAIGLGVDFGGQPGAGKGTINTYNPSDFGNFSSGVYGTGGPVSLTFTGSSSNAGVSKSWGLGGAYVTCTNVLLICDE